MAVLQHSLDPQSLVHVRWRAAPRKNSQGSSVAPEDRPALAGWLWGTFKGDGTQPTRNSDDKSSPRRCLQTGPRVSSWVPAPPAAAPWDSAQASRGAAADRVSHH